ncbi:hypothetical protein GCM10010472_33700 [Pseudonocardia halophobica]|uniref:Uncharacterized protein n=1 Tax=Pseudonocardia halophobica TaxID=29401 RepID=A0A9W6UFB5_9PSEU|nr:hypothetical protein [Pseudonocardia halophobica]GLL15397.1 hypothetical protein GCM10017577_65470 [Pseudonocardia halophobica]
MTTTQPERTAPTAGVLPDEVVRGEVAEDPTIAIPVVPRQYAPVPPPHPRPIADPYGPPAGLGPVAPPPGYGSLPYGGPMFGTTGAPAPVRSRKGVFVGGIAAGVAALGLVIGIGAVASAASSMDVTGTFRLVDDGYYGYGGFSSGSVCSGGGGYSDIHAGTGVTIANAAGAVIATGSLSPGRASSSTTCDFTFTVPDVPAGEDFYQVEVSHRGTLTYTADELRAGLGLSLGD